MDSFNYDLITDMEFDNALENLVVEKGALFLMTIPEVHMLVREHFYNAVLDECKPEAAENYIFVDFLQGIKGIKGFEFEVRWYRDEIKIRELAFEGLEYSFYIDARDFHYGMTYFSIYPFVKDDHLDKIDVYFEFEWHEKQDLKNFNDAVIKVLPEIEKLVRRNNESISN